MNGWGAHRITRPSFGFALICLNKFVFSIPAIITAGPGVVCHLQNKKHTAPWPCRESLFFFSSPVLHKCKCILKCFPASDFKLVRVMDVTVSRLTEPADEGYFNLSVITWARARERMMGLQLFCGYLLSRCMADVDGRPRAKSSSMCQFLTNRFWSGGLWNQSRIFVLIRPCDEEVLSLTWIFIKAFLFNTMCCFLFFHCVFCKERKWWCVNTLNLEPRFARCFLYWEPSEMPSLEAVWKRALFQSKYAAGNWTNHLSIKLLPSKFGENIKLLLDGERVHCSSLLSDIPDASRAATLTTEAATQRHLCIKLDHMVFNVF